MDERRRFIRFKTPLAIKCNSANKNVVVDGVTKDISMEGACVSLNKGLDVSKEAAVSLDFFFPKRPLKVQGTIAWSKEYEDRREVGVIFENTPDGNKQDIYSHIFEYHQQQAAMNWW